MRADLILTQLSSMALGVSGGVLLTLALLAPSIQIVPPAPDEEPTPLAGVAREIAAIEYTLCMPDPASDTEIVSAMGTILLPRSLFAGDAPETGCAHLRAHNDDDGQIDGFELSGLRDGSFLDRIYLQDHDVIRSINGVDLTAPGALASLEIDLDVGARYEVDLVRGRHERRLVYEIAPEPEPAPLSRAELIDPILERDLFTTEVEQAVGCLLADYRTDSGGTIRKTTTRHRSSRCKEGTSDRFEVVDGVYQIPRSLLDSALSNAERVATQIRVLPHKDANGGIDGYRLSAIRRGSLMNRLGIKNGDILHAINGRDLRSVSSCLEAYRSLSAAPPSLFELAITRRNQQQTLRYQIVDG